MAGRRLDRVLRSCNLLLRCASWIVPLRLRADWRREWEAEVWHWGHFLLESGRLSASTEQELLRHCRGAFADALWHRFNRALALHYLKEFLRTPKFCLLACLVPLAVVLVGRPAAVFHEVFEPASDLDSEHLLAVSLGQNSYLATAGGPTQPSDGVADTNPNGYFRGHVCMAAKRGSWTRREREHFECQSHVQPVYASWRSTHSGATSSRHGFVAMRGLRGCEQRALGEPVSRRRTCHRTIARTQWQTGQGHRRSATAIPVSRA